MIAYGQAYGTPTSYFTILLNSLARSKYWKLVTRTPDAVIYKLPPKTFPKGFSENGPTGATDRSGRKQKNKPSLPS